MMHCCILDCTLVYHKYYTLCSHIFPKPLVVVLGVHRKVESAINFVQVGTAWQPGWGPSPNKSETLLLIFMFFRILFCHSTRTQFTQINQQARKLTLPLSRLENIFNLL